MPSELHNSLTSLGVRWLRRQGFSVIATDLSTLGYRGREDILGFRSRCSAIIEVKVSRADFLVDRKKPHRNSRGIGLYRFYLCPENLIAPNELPSGWGLLHARGRSVIEVVRPLGNIWPGPDTDFREWIKFQHPQNLIAERSMLFSISRRLVQGKSILTT